jgi:glucosylceramidase
MGASDFALSDYTYDDVPAGQTDVDLARFSIEHDRAYILPVLKQAMASNAQLKVMGSPWSAPAWMKSGGSLFGGTLSSSAYAPYAAYFVKFIQAYRQAGVSIDAVTVQNEPRHESSAYPTMRLEQADATRFVRDHLGPAFAGAGIGTKIVVWDHNWDNPGYPIGILDDSGARPYVAGSAFHCYAGEVTAQSRVQAAYPDKAIYLTECTGGDWSKNFGNNLQWGTQNLIIGATRNWARTVLQWNLALDTSAGPQNGGCSNCRGVVTINQRSGAVAYNVEYYTLGHASKFVRPGARRIGSNTFGSGSIENVAFRNPDRSLVLVTLNSGTSTRTFKVRWSGQAFTYTLAPGAVATFTWAGTA